MKNALLISLILCVSCSPRLVPISYNPDQNTDFADVVTRNDITVFLEHLDKKYPYQIFDLEIINKSPDTIEIAPQQITFYVSIEPFKPVSESTTDIHALSTENEGLFKGKQYALSPYAVQEMMEQKVKSKKNLGIFLTVLSVGLAVYDAVEDSKDYNKLEWNSNDENNSIARDVLVGASFIATEVVEHSRFKDTEDLHYLSYEVFPESIIAPGQKVRGKVFINNDSTFGYYRIIIPVNNTDFVFDLRKNNAQTRKRSFQNN